MVTKTQLIYWLHKLGAFWSYTKEGLENMPDNVLIEHALRWGEVRDLRALFELFPDRKIKTVWHEKLIPQAHLYPHNYYLARIFFGIEDPETYIKSRQKPFSRYERIKNINPRNIQGDS